jgi:hypothetical protein
MENQSNTTKWFDLEAQPASPPLNLTEEMDHARFLQHREDLQRRTTIGNLRVVERRKTVHTPPPLSLDSDIVALYPNQQLRHCCDYLKLHMLVPDGPKCHRVRISDDCKLVDIMDALEVCFRSHERREIDLVPYLLGRAVSRFAEGADDQDLYTAAGLAFTINSAGQQFPLFIAGNRLCCFPHVLGVILFRLAVKFPVLAPDFDKRAFSTVTRFFNHNYSDIVESTEYDCLTQAVLRAYRRPARSASSDVLFDMND